MNIKMDNFRFEHNEYQQPVGIKIENFTAPVLPNTDNIFGNFVDLQPLHSNHFNDLYEVLCKREHDKNWTYLAYGPFNNFDEFCAVYGNFLRKNDPFFYAVINKKTQKPEGVASYLRIEPTHAVIEIGHISWSYLMQRTEKSAEAVQLMIQHAKNMGYRRIEWKCNSLNEASNRAALKYGFQFEGTFRQMMIVKGRNRDTNWYSIIV